MNKYQIINDDQFLCKLKQLITEIIENRQQTWEDEKTGLMWQVNHSDQQMTQEKAINYCDNLTYAGYSDWRLPTIEEIFSIIDFSTYSPACKIKKTLSTGYWSSTTSAYNPRYARLVYFYYGNVYGNYKSSTYYARAVRGGKGK